MDSPPPPFTPSALNPRNLSNEMDIGIPAALYFGDETTNKNTGPPPPPLPTPLSDQHDNALELQNPAGDAEDEELSELQRPLGAQNFREFCGNPKNDEERTQHLEHHVGHLIMANRAAEGRERVRKFDEQNLREKMDELNAIVSKHTSQLKELPALRTATDLNTKNTTRNANKISDINRETKSIRVEFNSFVQKAEKAMNTQTDAATGTQKQLALLMKHLNINEGGQGDTYAQKAMTNMPKKGEQNLEGWETHGKQDPNGTRVHDQRPPPPPAPSEPQLRKRGTSDRHLIDHHLEGLELLYFTREMEGTIGAARTKINEHIGMNYVVKSINFLGDSDNNLTEVCVPHKFARWFAHKVSTIKAADRVIGDQYIDCNPFVPKWDDVELIPQKVQEQRRPRHIKKILDQWNQCAVRSQNDATREFYKLMLIRIAEEGGRHLWKDIVYDIQIDHTMLSYPKVIHTEKEAQHAEQVRANKRRADAQHGPAAHTPISATRKRKGRKHNCDSDDMNDGDDTPALESSGDKSDQQVDNAQKASPSKQPNDARGRAALRENQRSQNEKATRPPAGPHRHTYENNKQRECGANAAGNKENVTPT